jgi:hypothetical protein
MLGSAGKEGFFKNQWILAYEKDLRAIGKLSLMMGKVTSIENDVAVVHVFKPRGVRKRNRFLPLWYRMKNTEDYDTRITDQKLPSDWKPWSVELDEKFRITAKSTQDEQGRIPPLRLKQHYGKVWDKKVSEVTSLLEDEPSKLKANRPQVPRIEPARRKSKRVRFRV